MRPSPLPIGHQSGKLTIIRYLERTLTPGGKRTRPRVECQCACGKISTHWESVLKNGTAKSCGCIKREGASKRAAHMRSFHQLPHGEAAFRKIMIMLRRSASCRNLSMTLTKDFVRSESQKPCYYCGAVRSNLMKGNGSSSGDFPYNGFDRVDNSKGYDPDNVVTCCWPCNQMRWNMSQENFLNQVKRIFTHQRNIRGD